MKILYRIIFLVIVPLCIFFLVTLLKYGRTWNYAEMLFLEGKYAGIAFYIILSACLSLSIFFGIFYSKCEEKNKILAFFQGTITLSIFSIFVIYLTLFFSYIIIIALIWLSPILALIYIVGLIAYIKNLISDIDFSKKDSANVVQKEDTFYTGSSGR